MLDTNTLRQSVSGKVDNHYFSRYVPFILANFAGAYAESLVSSTTIDTDDGGSVEQVNRIPDESDQFKYALGRTAQELLPPLANSINRPATGYLDQYKVFPMLYRTTVAIN